MKAMRTIPLDDRNKADEIKPGLFAVRQKNTVGRVTTIYLTAATIKFLAAQV